MGAGKPRSFKVDPKNFGFAAMLLRHSPSFPFTWLLY